MPKLSELAAMVGGTVIGDGETEIFMASGIDNLQAGAITLGGNEKAIHAALTGPAAAIIVTESVTELAKPGIRAVNPRLAFAKLLAYFAPRHSCQPGIHPSAVVGSNFNGPECEVGALVYIGKDVTIGKGSVIHPGAVIGDRVSIGTDAVIHSNVVIREECRLGDRVEIHDGTVIGSDGFGYAMAEGRQYKIPQVGIVVIEDDVEIGANTTIDRATSNVTLIKKGTKIDNLVQIAHNCVVGENCLLCGQAALAGSSIVGDRVTMAGRAGAVGHLEIGSDSVAAACSKITGNLPPGSFVSGDPARPHAKQMRIQGALSKLPEMAKELRELRKMVVELQQQQKQLKP